MVEGVVKIIELFNVGDSAIFEINNRKIHCFIPEFTRYKLDESWSGHLGKDITGKQIKLLLTFLESEMSIEKKPSEKIGLTQLERFHYSLIGKIVKVTKPDAETEEIVADCGFPIILTLPNWLELKNIAVGQTIRAKGRLDAYILE